MRSAIYSVKDILRAREGHTDLDLNITRRLRALDNNHYTNIKEDLIHIWINKIFEALSEHTMSTS